MIYINVFSQFIFYLIGTFLHEFAHYFMAILTFSTVPKTATVIEEDENGNKIKVQKKGFTIIPKIQKDKVVYGHVLAIPKVQAAFILIAIAPLIWIFFLYELLHYYKFLSIFVENGIMTLKFNYSDFFTFDNWIIIYLSLQLLWAGTLSPQDIKMFFKGVFSPSSLVLIVLLLVIVDFKYNHSLFYSIKGYFHV